MTDQEKNDLATLKTLVYGDPEEAEVASRNKMVGLPGDPGRSEKG